MKAIIMAGGKSKRLVTEENPIPKVLRTANGRPLLSYALDTVNYLNSEDIYIVVGYMASAVMDEFPGRQFAVQDSAGYGTGYAVMCAMREKALSDYSGTVAVLSGDVPLIKKETIEKMLELHRSTGSSCTILSCVTKKQLPFGRIIRKNGEVAEIKEHKDCTEEERKIEELNVATYLFDAEELRKALSYLTTDNAQNEYYLTDVPKIMLLQKKIVKAYVSADEEELLGVNTQEDLEEVEEILRGRNS